ncbi:Rne/Rng family ribonuclease [Anaerosalibacter sp. Marseille-P3206]|uniref:Rne/Rng family ribonuclease n=1 Tax=Anaerosalibacter sp. Marseille-P3206 TaxID=1871005 RepID=UPI00098544C5|nr:Rne/Rng family ribonuclease [Anaerosalibacter sp. Marseille-P3206]
MKNILIDVRGEKNHIAILEEEKLVECYIEVEEKKILGNIYRGRVINVLPGMEAAFVDIGVGKNAYLYIKDALPKNVDIKNVSINDIIKCGDEIIVQVIKEAIGSKGPKITTHLTLPGRYVVLTPYSSKISVSRKITNPQENNRLTEIGNEIKKDQMGFIMRTAAKDVDRESIEKDLNLLINIYNKIDRERHFAPTPKLVYREIGMIHKIVRDVFVNPTDKMIVNDKDKYESIIELLEYISPELNDRVELRDKEDIFQIFNVKEKIKNIFNREIPLECGGYIVIDETEALTSIDVNTGKYIGNLSLEETIVKTNLEATEEIARQLRLRDIGGIIIIDFIDMDDEEDIKIVLNKLDKELKKDRTKSNVFGITKLGLVEMTRKKVRNRLSWNFAQLCPYCKGTGKIIEFND